MSENLQKGLDIVKLLLGTEENDTLKKVKEFSPDFYKAMVEWGFGDIYSRPGLDLKQRNLLTLAALIAQGAEGQLPVHLKGAINVGHTPEEIVEIIIHCIPYCGFPKALGALGVAMKFFEENNIKLDHQK